MQSQNRFFDDVARVASGALGALSGLRSEIETRVREQLERVLAGMDFVSREEFEAVKAMAAKARAEQESVPERIAVLEARIARLEGQLASASTAAQPTALSMDATFEPPGSV